MIEESNDRLQWESKDVEKARVSSTQAHRKRSFN